MKFGRPVNTLGLCSVAYPKSVMRIGSLSSKIARIDQYEKRANNLLDKSLQEFKRRHANQVNSCQRPSHGCLSRAASGSLAAIQTPKIHGRRCNGLRA